ncbi:cAMP-binding domain of CRP or a regulatory subunit of cAMP-dependent protein kinases [Hymenobacter psychrotolerans DSM 18569]|uniref:cAMP-binding domain of CRP or a regulatory subunit of cAMP-dependent protein kinases n=2 Tax=Hymenobacter psychrotolerans TaxID=344998 RepID=A0A1M7AJF6_9BACT|nr:cAMP-binding domain of CRP or a regulatory subunit of cAMP-dependent protein kinases [Hymenobacter psychrotolerans DSM 18569]
MHCVFEGRLKVSKVSSDGKEQILALRKEGDALGSQALADSGHYAYSAVALSDCVVCMVPRPDFHSLLEQNPQFSHAILKLLAQTLGETQKRMLHTAYKPVRERLAEALLLLYRFFQPETASRLLSEFRDEGLVATQGSRIIVLDLKGLQKISALHA